MKLVIFSENQLKNMFYDVKIFKYIIFLRRVFTIEIFDFKIINLKN